MATLSLRRMLLPLLFIGYVRFVSAQVVLVLEAAENPPERVRKHIGAKAGGEEE